LRDVLDILLSQKFLPEHGGSIRWMYEVYRRWPKPVDVITHDYYGHPPRTPELPDEVITPPSGQIDHVTDAALRMDRRNIFLHDWGVDRPGRLLRYWRMTQAVRQRLNRHAGPVRVHCTHAVPEVVALLPLKRRYGERLRIVCYAHGEEITACASSRQLRWLMHRAHGIVDLFIANSENTKRLLAEHAEASRVCVVHPGVEVAEFFEAEQLGRQWRKQEHLGDRTVVLTIGRMDPRKNHAAVVEAVGALAKDHDKLVYICAGEGRQLAGLKAQAESLGVADRIRFPGAVDGPTKLAMFGGCDVFAMPAIRDGTDIEGYGMVFVEAGVCGKPSLAGCEGGQPEAVIDGETGRVVDGTDIAAVTEALRLLITDAATRRRMGEAARVRARTQDWSCVLQRTLEVVEKHTGERSEGG